MKKFRQFVIDAAGNKRAGVPVKIRTNPGGATAALYAANDILGGQLANPLNTNSGGYIEFYVEDGLYDIVLDEGLPSEEVFEEIEIIDGVALKALIQTYNTPSFALNRDNHTGTQPISTVQGLQAGLDNKVSLAALATVLGIAAAATHLGAFTGTTIPDDLSVKAALQALETASESIKQLLDAATDGIIYSSMHPDLTAAFTAWAAAGGTLVINKDYPTEAATFFPILQADKDYRLTTDKARKITYTGAQANYFLRIYNAARASFCFDGDLTINGQNLVSQGFWLQSDHIDGTDRRNCLITGKLTVTNVKQLAGQQEATGIKFSGGFDHLHLDGVRVINCTRAAGIAGGGCRGIGINGNTSTMKHCIVENFYIENVTTEDVAVAVGAECDGLLIFRGREIEGSQTIIYNGQFKQCLGRSVKHFHPAGGGIASYLKVFRSISIAGAIDLDFQHGDGIIENAEITYTGTAHGTVGTPTVTTPISMATSTARVPGFPFGSVIVRNVRIMDDTGLGKRQVVGLSYAQNEASPHRIILEDIYDEGTAKVLFTPAARGRYQTVAMEINRVNVNLTKAVCETDDPLFFLQVKATAFVNRSGANVPVVAYNTDVTITQRIIDWGDWEGDETVRGVHRYVGLWRGNALMTNGFRGKGGGVEDKPIYGKSEVSGTVKTGIIELAAGATWTGLAVGLHGANGGNYEFKIRRTDQHGWGLYHCANGTSAITATNAFSVATLDVSQTGAPSGASTKLEIYKEVATQRLMAINNTAGPVFFAVIFNP